jgi:L-rhamnonate dehydratase
VDLAVVDHLAKLLMGRDPFDIERNWDICWRSTMNYGRMGVTMNAISGVDNALWDIVGKALNVLVYKLLGGEAKDRIPTYCTWQRH